MKKQPKNRKFLKPHNPKKTTTSQKLQIKGSFRLQSLEAKMVPFEQLEEARRSIIRSLGKKRNLIFHVFPSHPQTKFPNEVRMGGRKRSVNKWVFPLKKRSIVFELRNVKELDAKKAFKKANFKLNFKNKFISS
jgi:large subunit ribosomal protein L16